MSRLTEAELLFLSAIDHNAKEAISEVSKKLKMRTHTANYILSKLEELEIVGQKKAAINVFELGFVNYQILINTAFKSPAKEINFVETLIKNENVAWLAEIGGNYKYALTLRARSIFEFDSCLKAIYNKFPGVIREQQIVFLSAIHSFGKRFISKYSAGNIFSSKISSPSSIEAIDELNYKIIAVAANHGFESERSLAHKLGIPTTTLNRRVIELENKNVIIGYYYQINLNKLGYHTYKLIIYSSDCGNQFYQKLFEFSEKYKNVIHLIETIGMWQAELVIEAREPSLAVKIANDLRVKFANINAVHILSLFRVLKSGTLPTLQN